MSKKPNVSESFSLKGWNIWEFIKGRKKLIITIVGLVCVQLAFDPELTTLIAGGAAFEGLWAIAEYFLKKVELK